jgi:hypothetical protein
VQSTNRQFVDFQFADPRSLDCYSADCQAADGECANRDRADGRGPKRECQNIGRRSGAGMNSDFALHEQPPELSKIDIWPDAAFELPLIGASPLREPQ